MTFVRGDDTPHLNETLGIPSARAAEKLFAAIEAEEAGAPAADVGASADRYRWGRHPLDQ